MKTLIHVDRFGLDKRGKLALSLRPLVIRSGEKVARAGDITINGPCRLRYSPSPHPVCGARVWIETDSEVTA